MCKFIFIFIRFLEYVYIKLNRNFVLLKMFYINVYLGIYVVNRKISKGKKIMIVLYRLFDLFWSFVCKFEFNRNRNI